MYAVPDVDEVVAVAKELGIHLGPEEAVLYRKYLMEQLSQLDAFVQARLEEPGPPMVSAGRAPGWRPSPEEDPLNAWMWKCRIEGAAGGLLDGKTVSFKDHIAVAGMPMSFGSFALDGFIPDFDATVVTRVLQAGGTIIGKNVMNGLSGGFGTGGAIGDYGRPLNPHNHEHVTGGSSSGSGAAVAAGEVDISFGGDQGGSIRIPAAFCGIVGHKPTFGLVSHFGIGFGSDQSIDYTGPMARTVEDAAAALQATAGYDPYDPRSDARCPHAHGRARPAGRRRRRAAHRRAPGGLRRRAGRRARPGPGRGRRPRQGRCRRGQGLHPRAPCHPNGPGRAHGRGRAGAVQDRLLRRLHEDLLPRLRHRGHQQAVGLPGRPARATHQAVAHRGRAEPPQLSWPRVRQGPERAADLHQGLRRRAGGRRRARDAHLHHDRTQEPQAGQLPRGRRGQPPVGDAGAAPATPSPSTTPATRRSPSPWASRRRVSRSACSSWDASSTIRSSCGSRTPTSTRPTGTRSSASTPDPTMVEPCRRGRWRSGGCRRDLPDRSPLRP